MKTGIDEQKELNRNQLLIAKNRYLKTDSKGNPKESVKAMFKRVSKYIASAENMYKIPANRIREIEKGFFEIQSSFDFLSGFTLSDKGRKKLMAACYVLPLEDSLESIYKTLYQSVQLHRLGAGIGYDFSKIRPEGSLIKSTGKEASGPISFMRLYDFSSEVILNRGSARHAGHMGVLRIDHPDIEKFIKAKDDYTQLTNFNLSIAVTDKFMKAYNKGSKFKLINPHTRKTDKTVNARKLMKMIAESVHRSGEPGIIFIDEINRRNTLPGLEKITATNLCGEQPLLSYESCNLGSIALQNFITAGNDKSKSEDRIDWVRMEETIRLAVRYLDNTIDLSYYILPEIEEIVKNGNRKIGLGVRGWADMLATLSIPYDSDEALVLAEKVMKFILEKSRDESSILGKTKGSFKNFRKSIFPDLGYKHMRNATTTTIAPTGTISLFSNCNGGIEPFFALSYTRKHMETLGEHKMIYTNKILEERLKDEWLFSRKLMEKINRKGSIQNMKKIPPDIRRIFKTSYEIEPMSHLRMQSAFGKYTDNAVSKTINVPENTTKDMIEKIYKEAYKLKLKGVTIYRNRSREKQVLNLKK